MCTVYKKNDLTTVADPDPNPDPSDPYVLGLLDRDPDLLVSGTIDPVRILLSSSKNSKKNLDSYCSATSVQLYIFEK
jgi:hypothetical protein